MDQGIIWTWKAYYRHMLLKHIIKEMEVQPDLDINPYEKITLLQAVRWAQEAWSSGINSLTLEHCFSRSQVKLHGPATNSESSSTATDDAGLTVAVEEEIYDCIRVLYPQDASQINLQTFLEPEDEVVEDAVEDLENQIINAYQPVPNEESEADVESEPKPAALIAHAVALDVLETLNLYKLQRGTMDTTLQQQYYRERRRIEGAHIAERSQQRQRTMEEFIGTVVGKDS